MGETVEKFHARRALEAVVRSLTEPQRVALIRLGTGLEYRSGRDSHGRCLNYRAVGQLHRLGLATRRLGAPFPGASTTSFWYTITDEGRKILGAMERMNTKR